MKEFIEKLIGRLEEEKGENPCRKIRCRECQYTNICYEGEQSEKVAIDNAISIVNQLAEEYNNDFCEWKEISVGGITAVKEPHRMKLLNRDNEQQFCPYCGKKIKIAPYQPKGE